MVDYPCKLHYFVHFYLASPVRANLVNRSLWMFSADIGFFLRKVRSLNSAADDGIKRSQAVHQRGIPQPVTGKQRRKIGLFTV